MKTKIKKILGKTNIVGVIGSDQDVLHAFGVNNRQSVDIWEWRVDMVPHIANAVRNLGSRFGHWWPIIVTVRDANEGGNQSWMLNTRAGYYRRYSKIATFLDIEAANVIEMSDVISNARRRFGTGLIVSCHFLKGMPTFSAIENSLRICDKVHGDVFKIAVNPQSYDEFIKFSGYIAKLQRRSGTPIAAMCVEKFGPVSRVLSAMSRSPLVYGSVGKPVIEGQLKATDMPSLLKQLNAA